MKTKILLSGLLFILITSIHGQTGWQWVNTGYNFILMDISFPPGQSQVGFAVGENVTYNGIGIILKTTDGGDTWTQISSAGLPGLEAVCFTDMNTGYIGGWQNYFAKTTDGGLTWTPMTVNSGIWYIKEIDFFDSQHGIVCAAGAEAYVTADGGASWTTASGFAVNAEDLDYASPSLVYAVGGDEKIARSTNGGLNWTTIYTGQFQSMLLGVDFYDGNYGVVGGEDGKVLVTTNGGQSWTTSNAGGWHLLHGVHVYNTDSALVAGTIEGVFKTTDGGITWISDFTGGNNYALYKIARTPDNTLFISGSQGMILRKKNSLQANFSVSSNMVCTGSDVQFTNLSSGNIVSWQWSFPGGNPSTSTLQNPLVNYSIPGIYDVQLIVNDGVNSNMLTQSGYIQVGNPDFPVITGAISIIQLSTDTHQVVNHPGSQYLWEVQGGTILSGANTSEVIVHWGPIGTPASLKVTEENMYHCIETDSLSVELVICIGMNELTTAEIKVYPEPAQDRLNISGLQDIESVGIFDLTGRKMMSLRAEAKREMIIDVSALDNGTYLLQTISISGSQSSRVIHILR